MDGGGCCRRRGADADADGDDARDARADASRVNDRATSAASRAASRCALVLRSWCFAAESVASIRTPSATGLPEGPRASFLFRRRVLHFLFQRGEVVVDGAGRPA